MEWELKAEMVKLGNFRNEDKSAFHNFVLQHVSEFDIQSWAMFVTLIDLVIDEMKEDMDFWKEIYSQLKSVDCNDKGFNFRESMRIALAQTICEDELKLV